MSGTWRVVSGNGSRTPILGDNKCATHDTSQRVAHLFVSTTAVALVLFTRFVGHGEHHTESEAAVNELVTDQRRNGNC